MKTNLRGKIRDFIQSEDGKVGIKSPLTLGVATGGILVAQAFVGTTPAMACLGDTDCPPDKLCVIKGQECVDVPGWGEHCWDVGRCE